MNLQKLTDRAHALKAGREIDLLVAREVMELEIFSANWPVRQSPADEIWYVAPENWETSEPDHWGRQRDIVWKHRGTNIRGEEYSNLYRVPDYSTDIASAWQVVHQMSHRWMYSFGIFGCSPVSSFLHSPMVLFVRGVHPPELRNPTREGTVTGSGEPGDDCPSLAICRAALIAMWVRKEEG